MWAALPVCDAAVRLLTQNGEALMSRKISSIALSMMVAGAAWTLPSAARAEYPDKAIHLIVPQAAGSATDTVARILANELGPQLGGQNIIVEDRPGGALTIGIDIVAKSAPDGYTIGVGP